MIDIDGIPGTVTAADFLFRKGNDETFSTWTPVTPLSVSQRPGFGDNGFGSRDGHLYGRNDC